jgi:hypothetical protein
VVFDRSGVSSGHQSKREVPGGARVFHALPPVFRVDLLLLGCCVFLMTVCSVLVLI